MLKLIKTVNTQDGEKGLSEDRVQKAFERWWEDFEKKFKNIVAVYKPAKDVHQRSTEDMVAEILELTRSMQKAMQQDKPSLGKSILHFSAPSAGKSTLMPALLKEYLNKEKGEEGVSLTPEIVKAILAGQLKQKRIDEDDNKAKDT